MKKLYWSYINHLMNKSIALAFLFMSQLVWAQDIDLSYYLPQDITYDQSIPTPKEVIGHEVGEWHVTHDKLYYYMKELAEASDRVSITEYARSHENRPLVYLTITSEKNRENLEEIRLEHKKLTDPSESGSVDIDNMPVVIYQGNSIHGNEPSGGNGALATAYYLAAAQGAYIDDLLDNAIILLDPCYNPDGFQRFSSWVNSHKGKNLISDPNSREYNEVWPRGRTNHYWFDLNRDWLLLTHPESQGRIKHFHHWKPDILTDHHEMGSNSTFFFQPGIPSRTNPNTPKLNQELTAEIATFHAAALDEIGSLYYSQESFDDYYYGKGSTYPDAQGCIGILFEQASSRGHYQATDHGILTFPFSIRNQVATMLSTQKAGLALRKDLLEYKRKSFKEAQSLASSNGVKGYVFNDDGDPYRAERFISILQQHQIPVYHLNQSTDDFDTAGSYYVPLDAKQYRLTKSIFEEVHEFQDSLFYDVSAWTLPHAFNLPCREVGAGAGLRGDLVDMDKDMVSGNMIGSGQPYAYLIPWHQYLAPRLLDQLHKQGVIVKLANQDFSSRIGDEELAFKAGTLIVPTGNNQGMDAAEMSSLMTSLAQDNHLNIYITNGGQTSVGVDLGSRSSNLLPAQNIMMVVGDGVNSYDVGEMWHHFDQVLDIPVSMIEMDDISRVDLSAYTTIILPDGRYNGLNSSATDLKDWIRGGGNLVAFKGAINWLDTKDIVSVDTKGGGMSGSSKDRKPYSAAGADRGARVTGGMIARGQVDTTHPLFYGYNREEMYFFKRGNSYYEHSSNVYNTPAVYDENPIASGYLHKNNEERLKSAAAVLVHNNGSGQVICIVDNPLFRGYWWGGSKLFANAIFMGSTL